MLVFIMVFVSSFGRCSANVLAAAGGYYVGPVGSCHFNHVSFLSYFLTLMTSVNVLLNSQLHWLMNLVVMCWLLSSCVIVVSDDNWPKSTSVFPCVTIITFTSFPMKFK